MSKITFDELWMFLMLWFTSLTADCSAGQRWNSTQCEDCPIGTFQSLPYEDQCIACRGGWTTIATASTSQEHCLRMSFSSINCRCKIRRNLEYTSPCNDSCAMNPKSLLSFRILLYWVIEYGI